MQEARSAQNSAAGQGSGDRGCRWHARPPPSQARFGSVARGRADVSKAPALSIPVHETMAHRVLVAIGGGRRHMKENLARNAILSPQLCNTGDAPGNDDTPGVAPAVVDAGARRPPPVTLAAARNVTP